MHCPVYRSTKNLMTWHDMYSAFKQFGILYFCRHEEENRSQLQGFNVAGVVIGFLICIPYTFVEGLASTSLFDKLPKAETYLSILLKGVELSNILILLVIVVIAIVIVRAALQDDREVCKFNFTTRIMHLLILLKQFDTALDKIVANHTHPLFFRITVNNCKTSTRATTTFRPEKARTQKRAKSFFQFYMRFSNNGNIYIE